MKPRGGIEKSGSPITSHRSSRWFAASIPGDGRSPLHAKDKPPLVRQASNADLSKTWPRQLPEDVPRRFLRTWVRAVPETMAAQLRNLH